MNVKIAEKPEVRQFLQLASGLMASTGNERVKLVVHRLLSDLLAAIEDLNITPQEFWSGISYLNDLGSAGEAGLLAAGSGLEHLLDLRLDAEDDSIRRRTGTSRTIEGPLYVAGAPESVGVGRIDDGSDPGRVLFMHGVVRDVDGKRIPKAMIDVWHANSKGMYSFFDSSQRPYNLRGRIATDEQGRYEFRSIVPSGYGCPPNGPTQALLSAIGRHGRRPAHIHFFVSAPGYRFLTTQVNMAGDPYLHDDFAFATREDLIAEVVQHDAGDAFRGEVVDRPFAEVQYNFVLTALAEEELLRHGASAIERRRFVPA